MVKNKFLLNKSIMDKIYIENQLSCETLNP